MEFTLTMAAPLGQNLLSVPLISQIEKALRRAGLAPAERQCLSDGTCYRMTLQSEEAPSAKATLDPILGNLPVDCALLPKRDSPAKLLIADMDSTIIQCECLDELADLAGFGAEVSNITERAMSGELDFEAALRERVKMLAGLPEEVLLTAYRERIQLMPGARILVQTMKANGATTALVSGGFTFFTSRVAEQVGFDNNFGNTLEISNGTLTGRVTEPILGRSAKLEALERLCTDQGIEYEDTIAVGDGANDLAMIERAGIGVAFRGKPIVEAGANVSIRHTDLRTLLYIQGYADQQMIDPAE